MKRLHSHSAVLLTAAAVLIPCGLWYWLGTRQLARESRQLEETATRRAQSAAENIAARLAEGLSELIDREASRNYLEYWPEYFSRGETCSAMQVHRSPLSQGKKNKMILAYFHMDEEGHVLTPEPGVDLAALDFNDPTAPDPGRKGQILASIVPNAGADPPRPDELAQVGNFRWQTGSWRGRPTLMASRQVITADHQYVQGFAVDRSALDRYAFVPDFPATLEPGEARSETDARLPILGAAWHVSVDPGPRLAQARARAEAFKKQFHQSFGIGVLGAVLAGGCVVVLIRRSERLAEERSRFAAAAAHELRTPLAGIRLHGEMLAMSLGNPARVSQYAQRITDEAERLTRLVSNVFSYTQVDQKRLRIKKERGNVGHAVREALTLMEPIIDKAGADLIVRIDEDLPSVELDKDAVHQMVRNLVDNAEKYTREAADRRIEVSVRRVPGGVELAVRDHGEGVPPGERARIFQPFAQHEKNASASGLGLGLAVVRTLAVAHGGDAGYMDATGGGACFLVRFPAAAG